MDGVLVLGLLLGMQHALEADHVAAVASLASRSRSKKAIIGHGAAWSLGHMLTLTLLAGGVILSGHLIGQDLAHWLEIIVGVTLMVLGARVLYRMFKARVHLHVHRHADGQVHFHAHSHAGDPRDHHRSAHDHAHRMGRPLPSLLVGMLHGLAGSAALVVLAASALVSPVQGLIYVALFGLGSVAGMVLLSAVIAVPLSFASRLFGWANRALQGVIGLATMAVGGAIVF